MKFIKILNEAVDSARNLAQIAQSMEEDCGYDEGYEDDTDSDYEEVKDSETGEYIGFDSEEISARDFERYVHKDIKRISLNKTFSDMEDRNNDWLARQLREEERILRRGDMLDLGASHEKECDSRKLKLEHHLLHMRGKEEM